MSHSERITRRVNELKERLGIPPALDGMTVEEHLLDICKAQQDQIDRLLLAHPKVQHG